MPFVIDAVTYAVSTAALTVLRTPLPAPERETGRPRARLRADIAEGIRYLWSFGFLRGIVAYASLINFATAAIFLVLPLKLLQAGVCPVAIGSIETVSAVAGILGSLAAPSLIKRVRTGALSISSGIIAAAAVAPMAPTDNVVVIGALLATAVFLLPAGNASVSSYMFAFIPDRLQGRTQSALYFAGGSLMPLGALLGGGLLAAFGGRTAMLVGSGLVVLSVLPLLLSRDVRALPTPDRWGLT